jgi:hypothetical protein
MPTTPFKVTNAFNPPDTLARTGHSITILFNGSAIGLINSWAPTQSRQVTPIYEINSETSGLPIENVPGNVQGLTMAVQRYDVWLSRMEKAFGSQDLYMLCNQKSAFSIQERWTAPSGAIECWQYEGCWFTQIGRNFRSDDTRLVNVNAALIYLYKSPISTI